MNHFLTWLDSSFLLRSAFKSHLLGQVISPLWSRWSHKPSKRIDQPNEPDLKRWAYSEWIEYQAWLFHHSFLTLNDWQKLRDIALSWSSPPLLSIITPVFNTSPIYLRDCIYSVQTQAYPYWEMCLVNDGSDNLATLDCLQQLTAQDPRLRVQHLPHNHGICQATNRALATARGEYVVFLDHDDRLAPEALFQVVARLRQYPETDILYSDRDTLSLNDSRFMHLFKPDWSPETLLSGNYLFHLLVYRRKFIAQLGGVHVGLEGSQDYDLILRAAEHQPQVQHIPKVLYHWRMHTQSVAMSHHVKEYAYTAGLQALQNALKRRHLVGQASENETLWRGHYRLHLVPPPLTRYQVLTLNPSAHYADQINQAFEENKQFDHLIVLGPDLQTADNQALTELVSWLQIEAVGLVTGKILNPQGRLQHAGLVQRQDGLPLALYQGYPEETPGYMAVTAIVRNVSTPHPACYALKRQLWQNLGGLDRYYDSFYALFDLALRALELGNRVVYTPFARFITQEAFSLEMESLPDRQRFVEQWATWLNQGDPYYNPHLTLELVDMGLNLHWSHHEEKTEIS